MITTDTCTVECRRLTPDDAEYIYKGVICDEGAMKVSTLLSNAFEYYQYGRVMIQLESPGGKASSLDLLLRIINKWERAGKTVAIRSDFHCASAAALLLSLSQWGQRSVDRGAMLMYHFVRIGSSIENLTAVQAEGVAHTLDNMDQQMLSRLLARLQSKAGGPQGLLGTINQRLSWLDQHWIQVDEQMPTSIFSKKTGTNRPQWHKGLAAICKQGLKAERAMALYEKHLFQRFKLDSPMDLREAYVLCLIDSIEDVIGPQGICPEPLETTCVEAPRPTADQAERESILNENRHFQP